jgi:hypothetical protein
MLSANKLNRLAYSAAKLNTSKFQAATFKIASDSRNTQARHSNAKTVSI